MNNSPFEIFVEYREAADFKASLGKRGIYEQGRINDIKRAAFGFFFGRGYSRNRKRRRRNRRNKYGYDGAWRLLQYHSRASGA